MPIMEGTNFISFLEAPNLHVTYLFRLLNSYITKLRGQSDVTYVFITSVFTPRFIVSIPMI